MNRLSTVLFIRSTLVSSRAKKSGSEATDNIESTRVGGTHSTENSPIPSASPPERKRRASESESTSTPVTRDSGSYGSCAVRRESLLPFKLYSPSSPFRGVEPWVDDDPFEGVVVESISVGSVPVHTPHLTDPIAPFTGFAMQAEVVRSTRFRKVQIKTLPDKVCKAAEESEGGLFFASRERGRTPQLDVSNDEHFTDERPSQSPPPIDYLKVDIPDISITLGSESSP